MATGVVRVPLKATGETPFGVSTALRGPAGLDVTHHLWMGGWHGMGTAVRCAVEAEDSGDFPLGSAGRAPGCPWETGGGVWGHGVTPMGAGTCPRKAAGRTGCGLSPDAAG